MGNLILILFFFPFTTFANIQYISEPTFSLEDVKSVEKQLGKLTQNIEQLENTLQDKNKKLIKNIEDKKKIEEKLTQVKEILDKNQIKLNQQIVEVKKHFQNLLLGEVGGPDMPSTLLGKKLLAKVLEEKIKELKDIRFKMNEIQEELTDLQKKYDQFVQTENDLNQLLGDLELKKKKLSENYFLTQEKKEKIQMKLSKARSHLTLKMKTPKVSLEEDGFSSPLEDYFDLSFKDKGLTFKFKGINQIFASRTGKVIYTGSLSTFGNVLMIDHGNNTRTVILGDMEISVKKGEMVRKGSIIGHTKGDSSKEGNLYFEVRNKDKVQKTISLMEADFYNAQKGKVL